jgi:glycosyltransferase involved in cell wall biosynthesis
MKTSVVIPAYNAEQFIGATIDSVLGQTVGDLEVVVVDDGSTDSTREVVSSFAPRVTLVTGPRRGVSAARNTGLGASRGPYVALMDHDDLWEPEKLARQAAILDADPRVALVFTQARVERDGCLVEIFPQIPEPERLLSAAYENLLHWNYIPMSSVMVRRAKLPGGKGGGPFDSRFRFSEDWDLWLRMAAQSGPGGLAFIPEALTRYRIVKGRATERMADLRMEDILIFEEQIAAHPELARADKQRCRSTRYRLREQAGYWLLKEGRAAEARPLLREAWRLKPFSAKPLKYLVASMIGLRPAGEGSG